MLANILFGRCIQIDQADRIARTDCDLFHIHIRSVEKRAFFRHRHGRNRTGHILRAQGRAFERIDCDIDLRSMLVADGLADEQHGRLVALAFSDHDRAVDGKLVELAAHCIDGRLIGSLLVAAAGETGR